LTSKEAKENKMKRLQTRKENPHKNFSEEEKELEEEEPALRTTKRIPRIFEE